MISISGIEHQRELEALPYFTKPAAVLLIGKQGKNLDKKIGRLDQIGYLKTLKKGMYVSSPFYELADKELYAQYLANRLRQPSYLSLEYVLAKEGLIPESVYSLTSVTLKTPRAYTNFIGNFTYRNIQKKLFCGYGVKMWQGKKIYLASKAKALFDYFYLNQAADPGRAVTDARINREGLTVKDLAELAEYTDLAKSRKMTKILQIMRAYVS